MSKSISTLETNRKNGKHQVSEQRTAILDAAEGLFLEQGLDKTTMSDIAAQAGITRMSLYRYFPNRDVIAVAIHERMFGRLLALVTPEERVVSLASAKELARSMIRNFTPLREVYRYMGMFESIYLDSPPGTPLAEWTKNQLLSSLWDENTLKDLAQDTIQGNRYITLLSAVVWFLEKLAMRGELTYSDQSVPIEEHLRMFEEMIVGYIDHAARLDLSSASKPNQS